MWADPTTNGWYALQIPEEDETPATWIVQPGRNDVLPEQLKTEWGANPDANSITPVGEPEPGEEFYYNATVTLSGETLEIIEGQIDAIIPEYEP